MAYKGDHSESSQPCTHGHRQWQGPVSKFRNATATALTDQVNGLIISVEEDQVMAESPKGTYVYENCVKLEGELTTQVNGLVVGIKPGSGRRNLPAHPGIYGVWDGCSTVKTLPQQSSTNAEVDLDAEFDISANHTIQINGGLMADVVDNCILLPKIKQA